MKAQELALFRKEQGLSLTSLGRLLKMRSSTLSDYERGKYPIPEEKAVYIETFIERYRQTEKLKAVFKDTKIPPVELSSETLLKIEKLVRKVVLETISSIPQTNRKPVDPLDGYRSPCVDEELEKLRERCKTIYMRG